MEGLSRILGQISADARAEAEAIVTAAKAEAEAQQMAAVARAQAERQKTLEQAKADAEALLQHRASAAALEARKALLAVKRQAVDQAFRDAQRALAELPESTYRDLLTRLACQGAYTGEEAVLFNPADHQRHGAFVVAAANAQRATAGHIGKLTLSPETRPLKGGLVLKEGPIETVCTLERLIAEVKGALEGEVASCLFEQCTKEA